MEALCDRLERIQKAVLNGEYLDDDIEDCILEAEEVASDPYASFEEAEKAKTLLRKARYLKDLCERWDERRRMRDLRDRLQEMISPEAWQVFLDIEEILNRERRPSVLD